MNCACSDVISPFPVSSLLCLFVFCFFLFFSGGGTTMPGCRNAFFILFLSPWREVWQCWKKKSLPLLLTSYTLCKTTFYLALKENMTVGQLVKPQRVPGPFTPHTMGPCLVVPHDAIHGQEFSFFSLHLWPFERSEGYMLVEREDTPQQVIRLDLSQHVSLYPHKC